MNLTEIRELVAGAIAPGLVEQRDEARRRAETDKLTNLGNREAFERAIAGDLPEDAWFVFFDLNNFGQVNKKSSHAHGDAVLFLFADVVRKAAKAFGARAFRYGGDEFVVICRDMTAALIRDGVERRGKSVWIGKIEVSISGEIGPSVEEADAKVQTRKAARKNENRYGKKKIF